MGDYDHLPVMQRPGYIYKATMLVRAKLVKVGDEVRQSAKIKGGMWKIAEVVEIGPAMVYVRFEGQSRRMGLGLPNERVWVDRVPDGEIPVPFPDGTPSE